MSKKKLKDTAVGKFLSGAGSEIIGSLGNVLPDKGVFGVVKNLIKKDPDLPLEDKERALALLQQDTIEMEEVSKRWASDMQSDSWLSIFVDSMGVDFDVDSGWVDLLKSLLITVYVAYFGSRGAEKFKTISK